MGIRVLAGVGILAAMTVGMFVLSGCSPSDESAAPVAGTSTAETADQTKLTAAGVAPAKDDTLLVSYPQDPDTINGITSSDTTSQAFQREVYESLGEQDFTDPGKILPSLATGWEFDEKTLTFTIHLRKGVMWHPMRLPNGELLPEKELTSRDVQFTFDCVLNPYVEAAHIRSYYEDPEAEDPAKRYKIKLTVVDKYTVKVTWTKPYFLANEFTLAGFPIIPRHVYSVDENGEPISFDFSSKEFAEGFNNHWANNKMCGTGPMMLQEWTRNAQVVLVRNPNYWGKPFYFSRILYRCIPNPNTPTELVLQNDLDFAGIAEKDKFIQCKDDPNVKAGRVKLVSFDYPGFRYVGYNMRRDMFKDKRFRRALAHAVPVQEIIDQVFEGLAIPVSGPFLPGSSAADPTIKPIAYDLDAARKLLDEAGWKDTDNNGLRDKTINNVKVQASFDLMVYADAPSFRTIGEIIKENCRKIGVEVKISPAKWALMLQKLRKWDYDAAMLGWGSSWSKEDPFQLWHGSQADVQDSSNHVGYRNDEVDRLIGQLRVTLDTKKQIELFHKIDRLIQEDQPYTFLFSEKQTAGLDARLENVKFYRVRPCFDTREWHSTKPRLLGQ